MQRRAQLDLSRVDTAEDLGCSNTDCDRFKTRVKETHDSEDQLVAWSIDTIAQEAAHPHRSAHSGETIPSALLYDIYRAEEGERTDSSLCTRVNERLDWMSVHFGIDVQHGHPSE